MWIVFLSMLVCGSFMHSCGGIDDGYNRAFSKHRPSGPMLSISRNVRLSVRLCVRLSICPFTFEVPFKRLFAPTSQSQMSNIFRDSESLGKGNGKNGSQL